MQEAGSFKWHLTVLVQKLGGTAPCPMQPPAPYASTSLACRAGHRQSGQAASGLCTAPLHSTIVPISYWCPCRKESNLLSNMRGVVPPTLGA